MAALFRYHETRGKAHAFPSSGSERIRGGVRARCLHPVTILVDTEIVSTLALQRFAGAGVPTLLALVTMAVRVNAVGFNQIEPHRVTWFDWACTVAVTEH